MTLLASALEEPTRLLASDPASEDAWSRVLKALAHYGVGAEDDEELWAAVQTKDAEGLAAILAGWTSGKRLMLVRDRDVLRRALKAYRKRLKITVLDAESSIAGGPMSAGRASNIVGIVPPERYPREVWDALVRHGKLIDRGRGTYELAP